MDELFNPVDKEMPVPSASFQRVPSSSQNTSRNCEEVTDSQLGGNASPEKKAGEQNENQPITSNDRCITFDAIKSITAAIDKQHNKMMLGLGTMGSEEGFIRLGVPLQSVPEDSCFEIKFVQSDGHKSEYPRQCDHRDGEYIKSFTSPTGKTIKIIAKYLTLHEERCKLCVYALDKDGTWNLIENVTNALEKILPDDDFDDRCFQEEVHRSASAGEAASQSSELEQRESSVLESQVLKLYGSLEKEVRAFNKKFRQEGREKRKHISTLLNRHRKDFEKSRRDSTPIKVHKLLGHLGNAVGYIFCENNGFSQGATCFVLRDNYILTCCHIVDLIVGEEIAPNKRAEEISKLAHVTFADEDTDSSSDKKWSIESSFGVFDRTLDYAVLRLKESDIPIPKGLLDSFPSPPSKGLLYIIGHLGKQGKVSDPCYVIPQPQEEKSQDHVQARGEEGLTADTHKRNYIHMFIPRSLQEVASKDIFSFSRYSGSPVFNEDLKLVAIVTASFPYCSSEYRYSIEFGPFLEAILTNISQQHKDCHKTLTLSQENTETEHEE